MLFSFNLQGILSLLTFMHVMHVTSNYLQIQKAEGPVKPVKSVTRIVPYSEMLKLQRRVFYLHPNDRLAQFLCFDKLCLSQERFRQELDHQFLQDRSTHYRPGLRTAELSSGGRLYAGVLLPTLHFLKFSLSSSVQVLSRNQDIWENVFHCQQG